ncbi:MAG: C25 family cysteine peptidase [Polyangiaceae bacterium]
MTAALAASSTAPRSAEAGGTKTAAPLAISGSGAAASSGAFLSRPTGSGGLNSPMTFYIEVPTAADTLTVSLWDGDVGSGGTDETGNRDRQRTGSWDTQTEYKLFAPGAGTPTYTIKCNTDAICSTMDNTWVAMGAAITITTGNAGHWKLTVDSTSTVTSGDDVNAFGVRATAGNGTELNVYIDGMTEIGTQFSNADRNYTFYPYVTSDCTTDENDYDWDTDVGDTNKVGSGSVTLTDRLSNSRGSFTSPVSGGGALSPDSTWVRNGGSAFTSANSAEAYGVWSSAVGIRGFEVSTVVNANYANLWYSATNGESNPPSSAQPTGSRRIYLSQCDSNCDGAGGSTAPVLPYVQQWVRHKSGDRSISMNSGAPTISTVTIKLVNPTSRTISINSGQTITSNIPSPVTYSGNAATNSGSLTTPSVGGSGGVTWTPTVGTIAAGASIIASYDISVVASSSGQTLNVTGTATSGGNGTTAVFRDATNASSDSRANTTFGPLCGLTVQQGQLTEALITDFSVANEAGRHVLRWTTASEERTIGFDVLRQDRRGSRAVKVNDHLLPALIDAPEGGEYAFVDPGVAAGEFGHRYFIVEVDASGKRETHGPFLSRNNFRPVPAGDFLGAKTFARAHRGADLFEGDPGIGATQEAVLRGARNPALLTGRPGIASLPTRTNAVSSIRAVRSGRPRGHLATAAELAKLPATGSAHIDVTKAGLVAVDVRGVAPLLRMSPASAMGAARTGQLSLTRGGESVAYFSDASGARIYFYNERVEDIYSDANAYRLARGTGTIMQVDRLAGGAVSRGTVARTHVHAEEDRQAGLVVAPDPEADYWFWEYAVGGDPELGSRTFKVKVPALASATAPGRLAVNLNGATSTGVTDEHHVEVSVNGTVLGDAHWTGFGNLLASFTVPGGILKDGDNDVTVKALRDPGVSHSIVYIDSFDLDFDQAAVTDGSGFAFRRAPGRGDDHSVLGLGSPAVAVLDIRDTRLPHQISGVNVTQDVDGSYVASFVDDRTDRNYFVANLDRANLPDAIRAYGGDRLRATDTKVDYLVITSKELRASAEKLAAYRRAANGVRTMVATMDEIYDAFSNGAETPWAIRDFVGYARANWNVVPRYVVLAGTGTYDYRELFGPQTNHVPPVMVVTPKGLAASDGTLTDFVDDDGLADIPIGRIPVRAPEELDAYVAKLAAFERRSHDGRTLLVADANKEDANFAHESDIVFGNLPTNRVRSKIYVDPAAPGNAHDDLLAAWRQAPTFVNYLGHGGADRLAVSNLMTVGDIPALGTLPTAPIVTAMTCSAGRFELPRGESLGARLIATPATGAVAAWMPSGLSTYGDTTKLSEAFYRGAFAAREGRLGAVVRAAMDAFVNAGGDVGMLRVYNVLGDPAVRWKLAPGSEIVSTPRPPTQPNNLPTE